jgi:hypothetical protein
MSEQQMIAYLANLPLEYALWWFIENVSSEMPGSSAVFFFLRGRMREEAPLNAATKGNRSSGSR